MPIILKNKGIFREFKYRNLIKNSHEAVSTPSVCVKYVKNLRIHFKRGFL